VNPLVSVVIPARNSEKTLANSLQSVFNQSYENTEVIVVVNGSSDSTLEVAKSFGDRRLRVIESSPGIVPALNAGLRLARGKYIARQDADDEWLQEKLKKQVEFLEREEVDVLGTQMFVREGKKETITSYPLLHQECTEWLFRGHNPIGHPSVVFRSRLLEKVGGYWELFPFAEDLDLWMRMLPHSRLSNLNEPLMIYNHTKNVNYNHETPLLVSRFYSQIYRRV
jgi:glycosyltransferase involved in cell wall biosynthesis